MIKAKPMKRINRLKLTESEAFEVCHSAPDKTPDQEGGGYRGKGSFVWARVYPGGPWHKTPHKHIKMAMDSVLGAITADEAVSLLREGKPKRTRSC